MRLGRRLLVSSLSPPCRSSSASRRCPPACARSPPSVAVRARSWPAARCPWPPPCRRSPWTWSSSRVGAAGSGFTFSGFAFSTLPASSPSRSPARPSTGVTMPLRNIDFLRPDPHGRRDDHVNGCSRGHSKVNDSENNREKLLHCLHLWIGCSSLRITAIHLLHLVVLQEHCSANEHQIREDKKPGWRFPARCDARTGATTNPSRTTSAFGHYWQPMLGAFASSSGCNGGGTSGMCDALTVCPAAFVYVDPWVRHTRGRGSANTGRSGRASAGGWAGRPRTGSSRSPCRASSSPG